MSIAMREIQITNPNDFVQFVKKHAIRSPGIETPEIFRNETSLPSYAKGKYATYWALAKIDDLLIEVMYKILPTVPDEWRHSKTLEGYIEREFTSKRELVKTLKELGVSREFLGSLTRAKTSDLLEVADTTDLDDEEDTAETTVRSTRKKDTDRVLKVSDNEDIDTVTVKVENQGYRRSIEYLLMANYSRVWLREHDRFNAALVPANFKIYEGKSV